MKLRYSTTSPYARKCLLLIHEAGLAGQVELVPTAPLEDESLRAENPLGKIPALVIPGQPTLFDSPVIAEYLDSLHSGAKLFPAAGPARWTALRLQAIGDGICDASVGQRFEVMFHPGETVSQRYMDRQKAAVTAALDLLEAEAASLSGPITIGTLAVAAALGYLDLRFPELGWRTARPKLTAWFDVFAQRPSMQATKA